MDRELAELRRAVADAGPRGPGRRVPPRLHARVVAVVARRRDAGESLRALGAALGLTAETLSRWLAKSPAVTAAPVRPMPVAIIDSSTGPGPALLALVTPNGLRVEGLTVGAAAELLSRLR